VAIGAVLVQSTSWTNAARAIGRLAERRLLRPAALLKVAAADLEDAIRPSGIYRQKARRLKAFAIWLQAQGGFEALECRDTASLRGALLGVHGIGPETADCILLYALQRPVFVVDAYAVRILQRLGLYRAGRGAAEGLRADARALIGPDVDFFNEFHALLVAHGKRLCRPVPECAPCALRAGCAFAMEPAQADG
jgi:endonuclease-3 related protein